MRSGPEPVRARSAPWEWLAIALLLVASALIQMGVVSRTVVEAPLRADAGEYFSYAVNLTYSGVYSWDQAWRTGKPATAPVPDSVRSPGYPFFLRMVGRPQASDSYLHRVTQAQALLGVLVVFLSWCIARRFLLPCAALLAAFLTTINPHLATISTYVLSESLFTTLLLASVLLSIIALQRTQLRWWLYAGAAWGACALVRPAVEFLPLLFPVAALLVPSLRPLRRASLACAVAFVLVFSPWVIRNASIPVAPGTSLMAKSLLHGSYPGFMYEGNPASFGFPYRFDPGSEEASRDVTHAVGRIASNFAAHPVEQAAWYFLEKPVWFLSWGNVQAFDVLIYPTARTPYYEDWRFALLRIASLWLHWPLMALGVLGAVLAATRHRCTGLKPGSPAVAAAALVAVVVIYGIAVHAVAASFPRYSIPFRPLLFSLACLVLSSGWHAARRKLPVASRRPDGV